MSRYAKERLRCLEEEEKMLEEMLVKVMNRNSQLAIERKTIIKERRQLKKKVLVKRLKELNISYPKEWDEPKSVLETEDTNSQGQKKHNRRPSVKPVTEKKLVTAESTIQPEVDANSSERKDSTNKDDPAINDILLSQVKFTYLKRPSIKPATEKESVTAVSRIQPEVDDNSSERNDSTNKEDLPGPSINDILLSPVKFTYSKRPSIKPATEKESVETEDTSSQRQKNRNSRPSVEPPTEKESVTSVSAIQLEVDDNNSSSSNDSAYEEEDLDDPVINDIPLPQELFVNFNNIRYDVNNMSHQSPL